MHFIDPLESGLNKANKMIFLCVAIGPRSNCDVQRSFSIFSLQSAIVRARKGRTNVRVFKMGPVYRFEELVMVAMAMAIFLFAVRPVYALFSPPAGFLRLRALQSSRLPATATRHRFTFWTAYHDGSVSAPELSNLQGEIERQASRAANHIPPPTIDARLTQVVRLPNPTQKAE